MKITEVAPDSPLYGKIKAGADLRAVNGHPVADAIDFHFHNTEETLTLEVADRGKVRRITVDDPSCGDLGLTFEETRIRVCNNKCIFCFVHQQPKGMRRSLYVKDDDYRYSFTHGNYISLSGMSDADFERIIRQRLSPLYISVHATDDDLRRHLFGNDKLEPILPQLRRLTDNGIVLHTQTVVCPGVNDGEYLEKTITDLAALAPEIDSLAVVPVGLTRYRERLPKLRVFSGNEAGEIIDLVESYHNRFVDELGTRFAFPADEFFLLAGRPVPPPGYYEEMPQFENGVGMVRQFIVDFNRRTRYLPARVKRRLRPGIITGRLAEPILAERVMPVLAGIRNLRAELMPVDNRFWGKTVTVTGLLTGRDILRAVRGSETDILLLPPNCLNADELFLDDISLEQLTEKAGRPVIPGTYNMVRTVQKAINLWER